MSQLFRESTRMTNDGQPTNLLKLIFFYNRDIFRSIVCFDRFCPLLIVKQSIVNGQSKPVYKCVLCYYSRKDHEKLFQSFVFDDYKHALQATTTYANKDYQKR